MCKADIFKEILSAVVRETEVSAMDILSSQNIATEIVDARYLLVRLLGDMGIYPSQIASLTGFSHRTVNRILTLFDNRIAQSRMMLIIFDRIQTSISHPTDRGKTSLLHHPSDIR